MSETGPTSGGESCGLFKDTFSTKKEAMKQANQLRKKMGHADHYWCEPCGGYHLTTTKWRGGRKRK